MKRLIFILPLAGMALSARASCGLSACDVHARPAPWRVEARFSRVAYGLGGYSGSYLQTALAGEYVGFPFWRLGGSASLVSNSPRQGHHKTGLSNPVLRAERLFGVFAAGALVELPLGDDAHGLASDHMAATPYAAWRPVRGPWEADLRAGYCHSFSSGEGGRGAGGHHAQVLVVNPHGDKEAVGRAALLRRTGRGSWGLFLDGRHVLDGGGKGTGFLTGGLSVDLATAGGCSLGVLAEAPLTAPRRFTNRISLRVGKPL